MRLALCVAAAAVLAGTALGAAPTAKPTPAGTLKAEIAAFNAKNWTAAYAAYTPKFKKACPFAKFKAHSIAQRKQIPPPLSLAIRITGVKTSGSTAFLSYQVLLGTQAVATVKAPHADEFVRVNGLWYDEVDSQTTC